MSQTTMPAATRQEYVGGLKLKEPREVLVSCLRKDIDILSQGQGIMSLDRYNNKLGRRPRAGVFVKGVKPGQIEMFQEGPAPFMRLLDDPLTSCAWEHEYVGHDEAQLAVLRVNLPLDGSIAVCPSYMLLRDIPKDFCHHDQVVIKMHSIKGAEYLCRAMNPLFSQKILENQAPYELIPANRQAFYHCLTVKVGVDDNGNPTFHSWHHGVDYEYRGLTIRNAAPDELFVLVGPNPPKQPDRPFNQGRFNPRKR